MRKYKVTKIEDSILTLDGNHPLAGKHLVFIINIVGMRYVTSEEIEQSKPPHEHMMDYLTKTT